MIFNKSPPFILTPLLNVLKQIFDINFEPITRTAFFESLKNKTVTLKSQATDSGENGRQGRMMNISSTAVTGVVDGSNTTLNEIITLVPTIDLYVSLYSSESAKS